jgi:hypothetical protein
MFLRSNSTCPALRSHARSVAKMLEMVYYDGFDFFFRHMAYDGEILKVVTVIV